MDTLYFSLGIIVVVILPLATGIHLWRIKQVRKRAAERMTADAEWHAGRELQQKRDHQNNHARRVCNWICRQLKQYEPQGLAIQAIEDNGGSFSIILSTKEEGNRQSRPILQLTYDFVKYAAPYQGHIHYGAYGADILVWVGDHAPFNGLDRLVIAEVERVIADLNASRAAEIARR